MEAYQWRKTLDMCSVDFTGHWQPGAVFRAMQDASNGHCAALGLGYAELKATGLCWVLTRASLRMDQYPMLDETVTVRTWPGQTRHSFFPRHYTFERDGREIGRATALYVLLEMETRAIAPPSRLATPVPACDLPAPLPMPGGIAALEGQPDADGYRPVYTDLDMNGHVNNTRYVDWFMNRFPCGWHAGMELSELLIHYHFEVRPEERMTLELLSRDGVSVMRGISGDRLSFAVQGNWRPRA